MLDLHTIVTKELGSGKETSKGNTAFYCPFCNHRKKKMEIVLESSRDNFGTWHCWVCDKSGHSVHSLFKKLNKHSDYLDHVYKVEKQHNKYIDKKPTVKIVDESILQLPTEFIPLSTIRDLDDYVKNILKYLTIRKITHIDILRYNIGYCKTGKYKDRIIIPNYDDNDVLNYFVGRYIGTKKYVINYDTPSVDKSKIIGFENLINWELPIYLVEGAFDAIAKRSNAIPLYGKNISQKLIEKLITKQPPKIYIILDKDAEYKLIRNATYLYDNLLHTEIYLVFLDDDDPNKLGTIKLQEYINNSKLYNKQFLIKYKLR